MKTRTLFALTLCLLCSATLYAQEAKPATNAIDVETLKQANNPLAHIKTVNLHNYYIPSLMGIDGASANQLMVRYAQPLGKFLLRGTMPLMMQSMPNTTPESGLGDFNLFAIYSFSKKPGVQMGVGPNLTVPTGTNNMGAGKWQAGLSAMVFFSNSPTIQGGGLLSWQTSFAGDKNRDKVNLITPQIFLLWQVGGGTYLRTSGIWSFDLEHGTYNVPLGLGIGRVVKVNKTVFNIFVEPQYSVFSYGAGQAKTQIFVGFNTQF